MSWFSNTTNNRIRTVKTHRISPSLSSNGVGVGGGSSSGSGSGSGSKDRYNVRGVVVMILIFMLASSLVYRLQGAIGNYYLPPAGELILIQHQQQQENSAENSSGSVSVSRDNATTKTTTTTQQEQQEPLTSTTRATLEIPPAVAAEMAEATTENLAAAADTVEVTEDSEADIDEVAESEEETSTEQQDEIQSTTTVGSDNIETPPTNNDSEEKAATTTTTTDSSPTTSDLPPPPVHPQLSDGAAFIDLPASERPLTPLREHDYDKYTIRILTWKRAPFLAASVAHHSTCPGVEQIQVVWSNLQEDDDPTRTDNVVPFEVLNNPKVALERRDTNQLTNRFDLVTPTKTLAILSLDDDVLYPCDVLDMGFFQWTQNPNRMITYFPRKHVVDRRTKKWKYSYWRGVEYSMALTGTAFVHRDYLYWYTHFLPRPIYSYIQDNMNCEDVAMTLFVSKLTNGQKPLAVDKWGMHCRVQLALKTGYSGIKNAGGHMKSRNSCVDDFAEQLQVKQLLGVNYYPGILITTANYTNVNHNPRYRAMEENRRKWIKLEHKDLKKIYHGKRKKLEKYAKSRGLSHQGSG